MYHNLCFLTFPPGFVLQLLQQEQAKIQKIYWRSGTGKHPWTMLPFCLSLSFCSEGSAGSTTKWYWADDFTSKPPLPRRYIDVGECKGNWLQTCFSCFGGMIYSLLFTSICFFLPKSCHPVCQRSHFTSFGIFGSCNMFQRVLRGFNLDQWR